MIASTHVYFAFFTCFFLLVAGLASCAQRRKLFPLCNAGILIAVIVLAVLANVSPNLIGKLQRGANRAAIVRLPQEAELYGMKVAQLLLPASNHRIGRLRHYKEKYILASPLVNENDTASLGVLGSLGFLLLIGRLLLPRRPGAEILPLDVLTLLNIFAVLLGTIGGFGSVFAWVISPWIACVHPRQRLYRILCRLHGGCVPGSHSSKMRAIGCNGRVLLCRAGADDDDRRL